MSVADRGRAFGAFVDAVAIVEQIRREQIPDLVRPQRPDLSCDRELVEPVGEMSGRIG
jgi:hypothetical protein